MQQSQSQRTAVPLRVHYLWDAIDSANTGGQGPADFERLMNIVTQMHKLPKDEFNRDLESAVKDNLVISDVIQTQKREETEVFKLPDAETFSKPDHDWYCFQCHMGGVGTYVYCEDCPRIFHLDCLPDDKKPQKDLFVCHPCSIISTRPSTEMGLKPKTLNTLLQYSCQRFHDWAIGFLNSADGEIWAIATGRDAKEAWRFDMLVYFPDVDLNVMLEKTKKGGYTCLEEFQVDCETLIHAIGVYFGTEALKGQALTASFYREVLHDVQEIKLCPDCFRRSNEKDHPWWFCLPCTTPHEVVWAKQSGYPYWPAKIMKVDGPKYDVRYFGGNYERGIIDVKNIQSIDTPFSNLRVRRTAAWNEAYDELQKFQEIALHPEKVNSLPATRGGKNTSPGKGNAATAKSRGSKRAATASPAEEVVQKKRKSNTLARKSAPVEKTVAAPTGRARKSGAALNNSVSSNSSTVQTNGVASTKKKTPGPKSATAAAHRRDSANRTLAVSPTGRARVLSKYDSFEISESFDDNDVAFLGALEDTLGTGNTLSGGAYFSDEERDEKQEKVSEDAVSSSVNETRGSRNVYIQTGSTLEGVTGRVDGVRECIIKHIASLKEKHAQEVSTLKKKQWCYHCEREAIYHCCWNTAYCSIECQQVHWTKEHKRLCRRVRRDRSGTSSNSQGTDDF